MEVVVAVPPPPPPLPPPSSYSSSMEFNFDSNCSSPYITAPSSPQRFGNFFFSAPTSPTRRHSSASTPTTAEDEFEFDFSTHVHQRPSLSADELFLGGKIRPLKPSLPSPVPTSDKNKIPSQRTDSKITSSLSSSSLSGHRRIRERSLSFSTSSATSVRRQTETETNGDDIDVNSVSSPDKSLNKASETVSHSSFLSSISFGKGYRKWRLKDFLLFRSASEGRASDKDPFRKYEVLSKTAAAAEEARNLSFRSVESSGSVSRRRGPVSAHELHYTVNRAASVEMKKKTLLPYKQGLLGCLGFNPGMHHFSARIGSQ
ncbi:hypothetical protein VNO80_23753 [Phaseolus coccineus]|uniref:Calmodulin-binding protein n=1 Tax=Phaseolus coccineus TaxID=3886 RepID=A0AAN9MBT2_PHACN